MFIFNAFKLFDFFDLSFLVKFNTLQIRSERSKLQPSTANDARLTGMCPPVSMSGYYKNNLPCRCSVAYFDNCIACPMIAA